MFEKKYGYIVNYDSDFLKWEKTKASLWMSLWEWKQWVKMVSNLPETLKMTRCLNWVENVTQNFLVKGEM